MLGESLPRPLVETWGPPTPATVTVHPRWRPRADVAETARSIVVTVELAGVDPDEVEAVLYEDALVIDGRRHLPGPGPGGVYHAAEINQGRFRLEVGLPARVAAGLSDARYDRGLLRLTLTKADPAGGGSGH
ncbi:MAG TPA: Hsp20/alpha crystallin family protein [Candidatus Limnocylindrales bacterium]|nr:Hsp20/alpha crystallin family protein [Candidatus Limnocylindrales bacterium]